MVELVKGGGGGGGGGGGKENDAGHTCVFIVVP